MISKNDEKQYIAIIVIAILTTFGNGFSQTNNDENYNSAYNNVINMVASAIKDNSINIALCKNTGDYFYSATENGITPLSSSAKNYLEITMGLGPLNRASVLEELRGDIDSLIFIRSVLAVDNRNIPSISYIPKSEWILFLESPFDNAHRDNAMLLKKFSVLNAKALLNSKNFFNIYDYCYGGVCIDWPKDKDYSPQFIYSKGLVDDFRTLIKLQKNPSLLSESADSYGTYYGSMKDDLGKQVFTRMFARPNQR
jgi:hypothetical protein